jgi:hypothetical protein
VTENLLRQGQLIGTFGPGASVDLPNRSVIMSGVGDWQKRSEDKISEPRLLAYLRRRLYVRLNCGSVVVDVSRNAAMIL